MPKKLAPQVNPSFQAMVGKTVECEVHGTVEIAPEDIKTFEYRITGQGRDDTTSPSVKCLCGGFIWLDESDIRGEMHHRSY